MLPRRLRVVVSPAGDEYKMLPAAAPPLLADATTFLHGKASHTILRSLARPYESCSLATPQAGA